MLVWSWLNLAFVMFRRTMWLWFQKKKETLSLLWEEKNYHKSEESAALPFPVVPRLTAVSVVWTQIWSAVSALLQEYRQCELATFCPISEPDPEWSLYTIWTFYDDSLHLTRFSRKVCLLICPSLQRGPCCPSNPDSATYKQDSFISLWLNFLF